MPENNNNNLLGPIAIGIGVFFAGRYLINNVLGNDPASQNAVNAQQQLQPATNPFNPAFIGGASFVNPSGVTATQIQAWGDAINNSMKWWYLSTDRDAIIGVFNQLTNKSEVALLSAYYLNQYGLDLFADLQGSLLHSGLSSQDLAMVVQQVNNLPN